MSCERWEEERAKLHALAAAEGTEVDPIVEDVVIGLRLLGFPTVGSCQGHVEPDIYPDGETEERHPYVGISRRVRARRFLYGWAPGQFVSPLWSREVRGSKRERHYMATLGWHVHRPMRDRLRELLDEFRVESGRDSLLFRVQANWHGVRLWPHERPDGPQIELTEENLARYHEELLALGAFLRHRVCG